MSDNDRLNVSMLGISALKRVLAVMALCSVLGLLVLWGLS